MLLLYIIINLLIKFSGEEGAVGRADRRAARLDRGRSGRQAQGGGSGRRRDSGGRRGRGRRETGQF